MCSGYQGKRSITAWDKRQPRNLVRDPRCIDVCFQFRAVIERLRSFYAALFYAYFVPAVPLLSAIGVRPKQPPKVRQEKLIADQKKKPLRNSFKSFILNSDQTTQQKGMIFKLKQFQVNHYWSLYQPFFSLSFYRIVEYGGLPYSNLPLHKCRQCE